MKRILLVLVAAMLTGSIQAQIHLFLEEQDIHLSDGKSTGWVFPIPRNLDEALDDLKDYCKDRSDLKLKKGGDNLLIAEKVSVPVIATKRGDLIGHVYITEQYYAMALVFKLGYDISVNSTEWSTEMQNLRSYAKAFMTYHYEQYYARRVEELLKEIKDLEKDKKQNENKINSLTNKMNNTSKKIGKETDTGKIAEYETEINTYEADIRRLLDTLPGLDSQINNLKSRVDQLRTESNTYQSTIGGI